MKKPPLEPKENCVSPYSERGTQSFQFSRLAKTSLRLVKFRHTFKKIYAVFVITDCTVFCVIRCTNTALAFVIL